LNASAHRIRPVENIDHDYLSMNGFHDKVDLPSIERIPAVPRPGIRNDLLKRMRLSTKAERAMSPIHPPSVI